jgi:hypothetical protein
MDATYSTEMSFDFHRTTRRYIPEDRIVHNHAMRTSNPAEGTVVSLNEKTVSRADNPLGFLSYFSFHARHKVWD